jgi:hypothetical protein
MNVLTTRKRFASMKTCGWIISSEIPFVFQVLILGSRITPPFWSLVEQLRSVFGLKFSVKLFLTVVKIHRSTLNKRMYQMVCTHV